MMLCSDIIVSCTCMMLYFANLGRSCWNHIFDHHDMSWKYFLLWSSFLCNYFFKRKRGSAIMASLYWLRITVAPLFSLTWASYLYSRPCVCCIYFAIKTSLFINLVSWITHIYVSHHLIGVVAAWWISDLLFLGCMIDKVIIAHLFICLFVMTRVCTVAFSLDSGVPNKSGEWWLCVLHMFMNSKTSDIQSWPNCMW